jgi:thiamine-monophosphate kinase
VRSDSRSEERLIELIQKTAKPRGHLKVGIGDDACVTENGTVITTDAYAEGVHFMPEYMTYKQVGFRCTCAAASDVVAMGAMPEVVLVSLALPGDINSAKVRALYTGIEGACSKLKCEVGGGDIISARQLILALTVTGRLVTKGKRPKLRSMARPGHGLYITGYPGLAEAGRQVLQLGLGQRTYAAAVDRHAGALPRTEVIAAIGDRIHALIDTSDGIATDANHIALQSKVKVVLENDCIPIHGLLSELGIKLGFEPVEFALKSGEDHELLFTSSGHIPDKVKGLPLTRIGRIEQGSGLFLDTRGTQEKVRVRGFDHFRR